MAVLNGCFLLKDDPFVINVPTSVPSSSLSPDHTSNATEPPASYVPTNNPSETPMVTDLYKSKTDGLRIRTSPTTEVSDNIIGFLNLEDTIPVIGVANEQFLSVWYEDKICYCASSYLVPAGETLYGYLPAQFGYELDENGNMKLDSNGNPIKVTARLIDVRLIIPDIEVYQIFGTTDNFTFWDDNFPYHTVFYTKPVPVLQYDTALKLRTAAQRFAQDGYTIKLYDAYRPKSVQYMLYDIVKVSKYIANPYRSNSNHNRGAAVDMTLIGPDGVELSFPTPMHTFGALAERGASGRWTEEQRRNVEYMTRIMTESGFTTINSEWWHFSDSNAHDYQVLSIDLNRIPRATAAELGFSN